MNTLGLYLHIPFCKSKCRYCDFCSFPSATQAAIDAYVTALVEEIESLGDPSHPHAAIRHKTVDTVYFGGGTPTLLSPDAFSRILDAVRCTFSLSEDAEITTECNPATGNVEYFRAIRALGINRLSIGAQSMQPNELKRLGRLHTADDVKKTMSEARDAGFHNVSLDLMFGIPEQTAESFSDTLSQVLSLSPDHLSVYGLQVEDGTYFAKHKDKLPLPDEDAEQVMYMTAVSTLTAHGIPQYEISNFAKTGCESRHNLRYWKRSDYLGFGLAAHSCLGALRFSNTESMADYLQGHRLAFEETISQNDILCESVMLGMRLTEGVDFSPLRAAFGDGATEIFRRLSTYPPAFLRVDGNRLSFTADGLYVSNAILADVLDFDE